MPAPAPPTPAAPVAPGAPVAADPAPAVVATPAVAATLAQSAAPASPEAAHGTAAAVPAPAAPDATAPASATPQPQPAAAATVAAPAPIADAPQADAATPQPTAVVPPPPAHAATPAQPHVPPPPQRSTPLHRAPEAVAQLLHVAADRGVSRARLALHPQELGGIEVQLSVTAQGLSAKLVADSPEAARMLAQAGDDLRRSLEARDVNLISLEVSTSGEERRETGTGPETSPSPSDAGTAESAADAHLTLPTTLELPDGLLVNVLA